MDPQKVTRDFSPPPAAETVVHETPHQKKADAAGSSDSGFSCIIPETTSSGGSNAPKKKYKPLPQQLPEETKEEKKKAKKQKKNLKKIKKERILRKRNWFKIISSVVLIVFAIIGILGIILVWNGNLTPVFDQNITVSPEVNINSPITNDFDPVTNNEYNHSYTIINEISCPEQVCVCKEE